MTFSPPTLHQPPNGVPNPRHDRQGYHGARPADPHLHFPPTSRLLRRTPAIANLRQYVRPVENSFPWFHSVSNQLPHPQATANPQRHSRTVANQHLDSRTFSDQLWDSQAMSSACFQSMPNQLPHTQVMENLHQHSSPVVNPQQYAQLEATMSGVDDFANSDREANPQLLSQPVLYPRSSLQPAASSHPKQYSPPMVNPQQHAQLVAGVEDMTYSANPHLETSPPLHSQPVLDPQPFLQPVASLHPHSWPVADLAQCSQSYSPAPGGYLLQYSPLRSQSCSPPYSQRQTEACAELHMEAFKPSYMPLYGQPGPSSQQYSQDVVDSSLSSCIAQVSPQAPPPHNASKPPHFPRRRRKKRACEGCRRFKVRCT
ncbi:hypothetical protein K491DRAFT_759862 [Lophiostoma macrostomum CBS 122681]|uniref:Zn(2)-C6 fungal-type domain-containing protein n=1 Tax=Lophiostoma macrostomum CBS 122681 TaxID=1314788 RepID=A0A6A6T1G0_9PLEO|nr:hypothetical protein K491DRAFT_759862 [Lophiostoma macrostomum CBS 122681]